MTLVIGLLFFVLFVCCVLAIVMVGAGRTGGAKREPDAHASLADDMHLAKVSRMASAMKADREAALNRMGSDA